MPGHALRKFWTDWAIYKRLTHIPDSDLTVELYLTCDAALQSAVFTTDPAFTTLTEPALATLITGLVTQQQNRAAARSHFRSLTQQPGEPIRDFVTRASQAAADCEYTCHACGVNQLDEHVRDQLFIGVCDQALQQDLLTKDRTLPTLSAVVTHCVGFESALRDQEAFRTAEPVPPAVHAAQFSRGTPRHVTPPADPPGTTTTPALTLQDLAMAADPPPTAVMPGGLYALHGVKLATRAEEQTTSLPCAARNLLPQYQVW